MHFKVMRARTIYSMNFLLICYKDPFKVPDMNFNKKSNRVCLVTMVTGISGLV